MANYQAYEIIKELEIKDDTSEAVIKCFIYLFIIYNMYNKYI